MSRLGEFAAAQRELSGEKDDFVFCGETFTVEQSIPAVLMLQLGAATTGKVEETEGFAAIWEALRCSLTVPKRTDPDGVDVEADPAPFNRLYKLAVDNGVELEALMRLVFALFEAQSGRPTQQVSGSLPGPASTSPSSSTSLTPAAPSHLRSVDDLIRGNVIQMGDGQLVEVDYDTPPPTERTG